MMMMKKKFAVLAMLAAALAMMSFVSAQEEVQDSFDADVMPDINDEVSDRGGRFPCMGSATYRVTVYFRWSGSTHPTAYPAGGVFSPHVVASHGRYYTMWSPNGYPSRGIQEVAETGNPQILFNELGAQLKRNVLQRRKESSPTPTGVATVRATLVVTGGRSYISSASMLFPSPDWFTGIQMTNMCNTRTGRWFRLRSGDLSVWDAGTDSGRNFRSPDAPIRPAQRPPIISILATRFNGLRVGRYEIERI